MEVNSPSSTEKLVQEYGIAERITSISVDSIQNNYTVGNQNLLIIDSTGILGTQKHPDYVLLSQSPKIHFERMLDSIQPKVILADGSNYKSYVKRWQQTCSKRKLPFHYTGEKGAYQFFAEDQ